MVAGSWAGAGAAGGRAAVVETWVGPAVTVGPGDGLSVGAAVSGRACPSRSSAVGWLDAVEGPAGGRSPIQYVATPPAATSASTISPMRSIRRRRGRSRSDRTVTVVPSAGGTGAAYEAAAYEGAGTGVGEGGEGASAAYQTVGASLAGRVA